MKELSTEFREMYPFKSHFLEINCQRMHYLDEGQGPALIMLHGNPTWSFLYRNYVKEFSKNFRVIVPDHIGCGLSDQPSEKDYNYTLSQRISDLKFLLNHLGLNSQLTLMVHDWGGIIGTGFATQFPQAISKIVVFNTMGFRIPENKSVPLALLACRAPLAGSFFVRGLNLFSGIATSIYLRGEGSHEENRKVRKALRSPYSNWTARLAVKKFIEDIPITENDPSYSVVLEMENKLNLLQNVPMLICWGDGDFVFDQKVLEAWIKFFPRAQVHRIKDGGHYVMENSKTEVINLLKTFLLGSA